MLPKFRDLVKRNREGFTFYFPKPLCKCPTCPSHHIYGIVHPKYNACIYCFSQIERYHLKDVFFDYVLYKDMEKCPIDLIEVFTLIASVTSKEDYKALKKRYNNIIYTKQSKEVIKTFTKDFTMEDLDEFI